MVRDEQLTLCFEQAIDKVDADLPAEVGGPAVDGGEGRSSAAVLSLLDFKKNVPAPTDAVNARLLEKIARRAKLF